jgi:hypothetical protein
VTSETKLLSVGDRVRKREPMTVLAIATDGIHRGQLWTDAGRWYHASELECIDPAPHTEARREQRISFAYGNAKISNPDVTRKMIEDAVDRIDAERIDTAPPAGERWRGTEPGVGRHNNMVEAMRDAGERAALGLPSAEADVIRTLTAERDAARADADSLREELRQSTMTEADLAADADAHVDELREALGAEDGQPWSTLLDEVKLLARSGLSRVCLLARAEKAESVVDAIQEACDRADMSDPSPSGKIQGVMGSVTTSTLRGLLNLVTKPIDADHPGSPLVDLFALADELERLADQSLNPHSARADAYSYSARMLRSALGGQP